MTAKIIEIAGSKVEILCPTVFEGVSGYKIRTLEGEIGFISAETLADSQR